jgi:hypothetical protein
MGYQGIEVPIPLGQLGLLTDEPISSTPPQALIEANNVQLTNGKINKSNGTKLVNGSMTGNVFQLYDYQATSTVKRVLAITQDGSDIKLWKDYSAIATLSSTTTTPETSLIVQGGAEAAGDARHAFFFTGSNQVQVLDNDGSGVGAIATPAADWSSNYPTFGIIYQGRLFCFGNTNDPHRIYYSTAGDHENFTGAGSGTYSIFPGEGEKLISATVYRGLLLLFKAPRGVYIVDGRSDVTAANVSKYSEAFGLAGPNALTQGLQDVVAVNDSGTLSSLQAGENFGDLESADILSQTKTEQYFRDQLDNDGFSKSYGVYYQERKQFYFTMRNQGDTEQNRIIVLDRRSNVPKVTLETKDQPTCLAMIRDADNILRPYYGDNNGDVYRLDDEALNNKEDSTGAGQSFNGSFQTAYTNLNFIDPQLGGKNKHFDFIQVTARNIGSFSIFVEVYIDQDLRFTHEIQATATTSTLPFQLPAKLSPGEVLISERFPLYGCYGKRISIRMYNDKIGESFQIEDIILYFRPADEGFVG